MTSRAEEMQAIVNETGMPLSEVESYADGLRTALEGTRKRALVLSKKDLATLFASIATHYAIFYPDGYDSWQKATLRGME